MIQLVLWRVLFLTAVLSAVVQGAVCPAVPSEARRPVGFRIVQVPQGPKMAVWYPASQESIAAATRHSYSPVLSSQLVERGEPDRCTRLPLIVFSHGFLGCATQSVFLTEELARAGYIVAAPDHDDAGCSLDHAGAIHPVWPRRTFLTGWGWSERTYGDRRRDLRAVIDYMLEASAFSSMIDSGRIGALGHSLGGYSVLGLAGAWPGWHDPRIRAVAAVSPFVKPYLRRALLKNIQVPVMYQGAQHDWGMTPGLRGTKGAYARTAEPKYYVELSGGSHLEWTNAVCLGHLSVDTCLQKSDNARLIAEYTRAFFDRYLKDDASALDQLHGDGLRAFSTSLSTSPAP